MLNNRPSPLKALGHPCNNRSSPLQQLEGTLLYDHSDVSAVHTAHVSQEFVDFFFLSPNSSIEICVVVSLPESGQADDTFDSRHPQGQQVPFEIWQEYSTCLPAISVLAMVHCSNSFPET